MIRVYMEWTPEQHPSMYYVLNKHHRRWDSDMIILILSTTETSYLNGTVQHMTKANRRSDMIYENIKDLL